MVMPRLSGTAGSVRASMKKSLPMLPFAMYALLPFRIHSSPRRSALSLRPARGSSGGRRLSEPASYSLMPLPSTKVSSARKGLRNLAFCSSVQLWAIRWLHFQHWLKLFEIALSALASSAITSAWVTKSVPSPPHCLGTARVRKPSLEPFVNRSQSQVFAGSSIASRASETGRMSSVANFLALACHRRCSSLSSKSMVVPLRVQADARVAHELVQRHVAHHAHRAEALGGVLRCREHRIRREGLGNGLERQAGEAAIGDRLGMIRGPGRSPHRGARDLQADGDPLELRRDRLMLDDRLAALHPDARVIERGLVRGAPDTQADRREDSRERPGRAYRIRSRNAAIRESHLAAAAVVPVAGLVADREAFCLARHEQRPFASAHEEEFRDRCIGHP